MGFQTPWLATAAQPSAAQKAPFALMLPTPLPNQHLALASLKLSRRASLLAPASCTLAMDITLPKKEKAATNSSFSL